MSNLDSIPLAWTCLLSGWTLVVIREHAGVTRERKALQAATLEMLRRTRSLPMPATCPEQKPPDR